MKIILVALFYILFNLSLSEIRDGDEPTSSPLEIFIRTRNMTGEVVTFFATTQSNPRWSASGYLTTGMTSASITIEGNLSEGVAGFDTNGDAPNTYNVDYLGAATYLLTVINEFNSKNASVTLVCNGWSFTDDKWLLYDFLTDSFYLTVSHDTIPIENVTGDSIIIFNTQYPSYCFFQPTDPFCLSITNYNNHPKLSWTASEPVGGTKYQIYRNNELVFVTNIGQTEWIDENIHIGGGVNDPFTYKVQGLSGDETKTSSGYSNSVTVNGIQYEKRQSNIGKQSQWTSMIEEVYPNPFNPEVKLRFTVGEE